MSFLLIFRRFNEGKSAVRLDYKRSSPSAWPRPEQSAQQSNLRIDAELFPRQQHNSYLTQRRSRSKKAAHPPFFADCRIPITRHGALDYSDTIKTTFNGRTS